MHVKCRKHIRSLRGFSGLGGSLMRRIVLLAVLALALPMAAFASSSVDFSNSGGTLAGTNAGLTLTGSTLIAVNGLNGGGVPSNQPGAGQPSCRSQAPR